MSLTTCGIGHDDIAYDDYVNRGRSRCPLCTALERIEELEKEVGTLETQVDELTEELAEARESAA